MTSRHAATMDTKAEAKLKTTQGQQLIEHTVARIERTMESENELEKKAPDPGNQEERRPDIQQMYEMMTQMGWQPPQLQSQTTCYKCKGLNHISRDCTAITGAEGDEDEGEDTLMSQHAFSQIAEQCDLDTELVELMGDIVNTWDRLPIAGEQQNQQDITEEAMDSFRRTNDSEMDIHESVPGSCNESNTSETSNRIVASKKDGTTRVCVERQNRSEDEDSFWSESTIIGDSNLKAQELIGDLNESRKRATRSHVARKPEKREQDSQQKQRQWQNQLAQNQQGQGLFQRNQQGGFSRVNTTPSAAKRPEVGQPPTSKQRTKQQQGNLIICHKCKMPNHISRHCRLVTGAEEGEYEGGDWENRQTSPDQIAERRRQNSKMAEYLDNSINSWDTLSMVKAQQEGERRDPMIVNWEHPHLNLFNALNGREQPIPAGVNRSVTPSLWDTGAGITLLSERKAKELGIVPNDFRPNVSGIGGRVDVKGCCEFDLQIFDMVRRVSAKVVDPKDSFDGYPFDLVIGGEARKQFPRATIDENKMTFVMDGKIQQMGDIRRITVTIIEPRMEQLITGYLWEANSDTDKWLIEPAVREDGLFVTPGIIKGNKFKMLVGNTSKAPITIYTDTVLAKAIPLEEINGRLYEKRSHTYGEASVLFMRGEDSDLKDLTASSPRPQWPFKSEEKKEKRVDPKYKVDLSKCEISDKSKAKLEKLLKKYEDFLSTHTFDIGALKVKPELHTTTTEVPITSRIIDALANHREEVARQIKELVDLEIYIESDTPWISDFIIVPKRNGTIRACLDFRPLNSITVPDRYPILRDEEVLELIANYYNYATLDTLKGYDRIPREDNFSYKCGFITEGEVIQLQTTARPFQLKNATEVFAKLIAKVLKELTRKRIVIFVDDLVLRTKEQELDEQLEILEKVLKRLREFNPKDKVGIPICPTLVEQSDNSTLNIERTSEDNTKKIEVAYHQTPEMTEPQDQCINAAKTIGVNSVSIVLTNSNLESEGHDLEESLIKIRKAQREDPEMELVFDYIENNVQDDQPKRIADVETPPKAEQQQTSNEDYRTSPDQTIGAVEPTSSKSGRSIKYKKQPGYLRRQDIS